MDMTEGELWQHRKADINFTMTISERETSIPAELQAATSSLIKGVLFLGACYCGISISEGI